MNIVLVKPMILKKNLTYEAAIDLLKLALESPAATIIGFNIESTPNDKGWSLVGRHKKLNKMFLECPEKFVISPADGN